MTEDVIIGHVIPNKDLLEFWRIQKKMCVCVCVCVCLHELNTHFFHSKATSILLLDGGLEDERSIEVTSRKLAAMQTGCKRHC